MIRKLTRCLRRFKATFSGSNSISMRLVCIKYAYRSISPNAAGTSVGVAFLGKRAAIPCESRLDSHRHSGAERYLIKRMVH